MKKLLCFWLLAFTLPLVLSAALSHADGGEDLCAAGGITVRNATMLDLWYKKNNGPCQIWTHEHLLKITPEESVDIFSDLTCETLYCQDSPTYKDYKAIDVPGHCRVKILPFCHISDM